MLGKIGLIVLSTAGLLVSVLTTALYAAPLMVGELTKMYAPSAVKVESTARSYMTDEQMCSHINQDTLGSCIPNADLGDGLENYKAGRTTTTVAASQITIDFPAWVSDDDIDKAMKKNLPAGLKYDIWHTARNGGH